MFQVLKRHITIIETKTPKQATQIYPILVKSKGLYTDKHISVIMYDYLSLRSKSHVNRPIENTFGA